MTTHPIDRGRLRRYLSHAAMLLPPDERVVTVEEGVALLDELDALQAIHRDALSHARRIIAHPDRWHHQDLVDATSNMLSALKGAPTVRDGATQWRERAVRAEAQSETRRQQTKYWQERAEGFEARIKAVEAEIERHEKHLGPDPLIPGDRIRRALDAP